MKSIVMKGVFCPPRGRIAQERFEELIKQITDVKQETCGYATMTVLVDLNDDCLIIQLGENNNDLQISLTCSPLRKLMREAAEEPREIAKLG